MWSFACICFELVTGDVLFDPHSGDNYDRDEDHLALMMELLGMMPRKVALGGRYSRKFFNRFGDLRPIRRLRFWPLNKVLMEKYEFCEQDACDMADFLVQILDFVPEKRPTASQCLHHPWISGGPQQLAPSISKLENGGRETKENGDSDYKSEKNGGSDQKREKGGREATENGGSYYKREKDGREAVENGDPDQRREKDEREAMKVRVGNMAIGATNSGKDSKSISSPLKKS